MLSILILLGIAAFACACVGLHKIGDALGAWNHCRYRDLSDQHKHDLKTYACLIYLPLLAFLLFLFLLHGSLF